MDNISKIMYYVTMVAKDPVDVDGRVYFNPKEHIKLQQSFFFVDGCVNCGGCCVAESNVYSISEYKHILNCNPEEFDSRFVDYRMLEVLKSGIREEVHMINGNEIPFYVYDLEENNLFLPTKDKVIPRCSWVRKCDDDRFRCIIHPVVSMTCDMPHLRFNYSKSGSVSIGTQQFGRNWALGCKVEFFEPQTEEHFEQIKAARIHKLNRIDQVAADMKVETWVPDIIEYIQKIPFSNYHEFLQKDTVVLHKKFFGRTM